MRFKFYISILIPLLFFGSCVKTNRDNNENPIARVHDQYLYPSDLSNLIPSGLLLEDSVRIARRLVEEWTQDRLLLYQAELHLSEEQKNIEKQVEEYRSSLLTFRYKQLLLQENLDDNISDQEIENYYSENLSNYVLESDLVQVNYFKIPASAPQIPQVRIWYRSNREDYKNNLKEYAKNYATHYSIGDSTWIYFNDLVQRTPLKIEDTERYLNYNRNIEASDSSYHHFIRIINRLKEGDIKPLELVKDNIKSVLLNKRKIEYIQDLENTVYKDGISRNQVEIY